MRGKRSNPKKSGTKILVIILIILIIASGGVLAYKIIKDKEKEEVNVSEEDNVITAPIDEKQVEIFKGNDRPIAVMIDNHSDAWPQAGLQKAYMIYEIVVEGGETRLMALFKGVDVEKIGQ